MWRGLRAFVDVLWKAFLWDAQPGGEIPLSSMELTWFQQGNKEQKGPAGALRHFSGFSLTKITDSCHLWPMFRAGEQNSVSPAAFSLHPRVSVRVLWDG